MNETYVQCVKKKLSHSLNDDTCVEVQKPRSSNLELYRIICMLMIVAHHYVVNSGLFSEGGPLIIDYTSGKSLFMTLFGAWGKTGINCFLMITGYFMCTRNITPRKFLKLIGQIYTYNLLLFLVFLCMGYETLSPTRLIKIAFPFWGFKTNFISCFVGFWLTIPFLNILVQNMTKRQHELLLLLMFGMFTLLGSIPTFQVGMEYIIWFGIIYLLSSFIRLYPYHIFNLKEFWGWMTLASLVLAIVSIVGQRLLLGERVGKGYFFVSDCNKIFPVVIALCSFLWFKNMNIKYSRIINAFGAGTFGVLLIHANSWTMIQWLWKDTVNVIEHYQSMDLSKLVFFSFGIVSMIFIICNLIDQLRTATLEKWFFRWYDSKMSARIDSLIQKII